LWQLSLSFFEIDCNQPNKLNLASESIVTSSIIIFWNWMQCSSRIAPSISPILFACLLACLFHYHSDSALCQVITPISCGLEWMKPAKLTIQTFVSSRIPWSLEYSIPQSKNLVLPLESLVTFSCFLSPVYLFFKIWSCPHSTWYMFVPLFHNFCMNHKILLVVIVITVIVLLFLLFSVHLCCLWPFFFQPMQTTEIGKTQSQLLFILLWSWLLFWIFD